MNIPDETQVIVTFIGRGHIHLQSRGINRTQAEELRSKLAMFAEDWDSPEMSVYDDYDAFRDKFTNCQARPALDCKKNQFRMNRHRI